jgi:hypothetical protein
LLQGLKTKLLQLSRGIHHSHEKPVFIDL